MKAKFLQIGDRCLPSYLGYGILNENSVKSENDVITADYCLEYDGSVVHHVKWNAGFCQLDTLLHGISCRTSYYRKLEHAILAELQTNDFISDPVFNFLMQTITKLGNIYVQYPGADDERKRAVFFPAGLMMCFRLPLKDKTPEWYNFLDKATNNGYIYFSCERKSTLMLCDTGYCFTQEPITMVDFVVPLAFITSAAREFAENGIIDSRMPYRLMILESLQAETTSKQIFSGNKSFPLFGICYNDLPEHITVLRNAVTQSAEHLKARMN